jgi:hypothetical protein
VLPLVNAYVTVPEVSKKLKLIGLFGLVVLVVATWIVLVTAVPPPVHSTNGVPNIVGPELPVDVFQIVVVIEPFNTSLPVPKSNVLS